MESRNKSLTENQRSEILRRCNTETITSLAKTFQVDRRTIYRIKEKGEEKEKTGVENISPENLRKKQNNPDIQTKCEILRKVKSGESIRHLMTEYNISNTTLWRIKRDEQKIMENVNILKSKNRGLNRKKLCGNEESKLDKIVYDWILQERTLNNPISGPLIMTKAFEIGKELKRLQEYEASDKNTELKKAGEFKASNGWLYRFCQRYGIRQLTYQGEKCSNDHDGAKSFSEEFSGILYKNGYQLDQVYNADESGLNYRSLPSKTLATTEEKQISGFKQNKERVTVMFCANVTGSHKIPLMVIGKSKNPRCFDKKKKEKMPVMYAGQKSAWMDRLIFLEWFKNTFIKEVTEKHQHSEEKPRKVLLLLDNAPSHPPLSVLNDIDSTIQVMYLPPNVTALIQPMDQGVIEKCKKIYRKYMMKELIFGKTGTSMHEQAKKVTMKDCCYRIASAWNQVTPLNIQNAWNKLMNRERSTIEQEDHAMQILFTLHQLPEYQHYDYEDIKEWLKEDQDDHGCEVLNTEELIRRHTSDLTFDDGLITQSWHGDDSQSEQCSDEVPQKEKILSPVEAYQSLMSYRMFMEDRLDSTKDDLIRIQELIDQTLDMII